MPRQYSEHNAKLPPVRLPAEMLETLREAASDKGYSNLSDYIREALQDHCYQYYGLRDRASRSVKGGRLPRRSRIFAYTSLDGNIDATGGDLGMLERHRQELQARRDQARKDLQRWIWRNRANPRNKQMGTLKDNEQKLAERLLRKFNP